MTKTKRFFFKSSAEKFANNLRKQGQVPDIYPAHNFGPAGCFYLPWGWDVVWLEQPTITHLKQTKL